MCSACAWTKHPTKQRQSRISTRFTHSGPTEANGRVTFGTDPKRTGNPRQGPDDSEAQLFGIRPLPRTAFAPPPRVAPAPGLPPPFDVPARPASLKEGRNMRKCGTDPVPGKPRVSEINGIRAGARWGPGEGGGLVMAALLAGLRLTTGPCLSNIRHDPENNECGQEPVPAHRCNGRDRRAAQQLSLGVLTNLCLNNPGKTQSSAFSPNQRSRSTITRLQSGL